MHFWKQSIIKIPDFLKHVASKKFGSDEHFDDLTCTHNLKTEMCKTETWRFNHAIFSSYFAPYLKDYNLCQYKVKEG